MSLSTKDKTLVKAFWDKASKNADDIGCEALSRMLFTYPATKTYFAHWDDLTPGSAPIRKHGKVIMKGLATAISKIDDLDNGLSKLSEIHATKLKVDPANFKILSQCILVVLSMKFPNDLTPETHVAMDKFLNRVSQAMSEKYR